MRLTCGVGIKDVDYLTRKMVMDENVKGKQKQVWICPFFRSWRQMLVRCFNEKYKNKHPAYRDATCTESWFKLSVYKTWAEQQDYENKCLDKDILVMGNKLYSPETCAFVNATTNLFVVDLSKNRGNYPLGVSMHKGRQMLQSMCHNPFTKTGDHLGYFLTPKEAHEAWRKRKHELAQLVAATESDPRIVAALKKRYSVEDWYKNKEGL